MKPGWGGRAAFVPVAGEELLFGGAQLCGQGRRRAWPCARPSRGRRGTGGVARSLAGVMVAVVIFEVVVWRGRSAVGAADAVGAGAVDAMAVDSSDRSTIHKF